MIVSVTERQVFKRCRRRWDYASFSRQSLSPVVNAPALDLGTLIHSTLADWTQDPQLNPNEIYTAHSTTLLGEIIQSYTERVGCKPSTSELQKTLEAVSLGYSMIENYMEYWRTPLPPGFTLVENEQTLTVPIPNTLHCTCVLATCKCTHYCIDECLCIPTFLGSNDPLATICSCMSSHHLEATFDGIMADEHGQLFIIERKTFSRHPSIDELDRNDQFLAYMWALQQGFTSISSSARPEVVGVAYDGLWKREKPPTGKKLTDLFLRRILLRNRAELKEFGTLLALEVQDMSDQNVLIYKNVPVLGGCWDCNFKSLCDAQSRGENLNYIQSMYHKVDRKEWRHTRETESDATI